MSASALASPAMPGKHGFDPSILRAYDIRGIVGETLNSEDAYYLGLAYGTKVRAATSKRHPRIAVAYDGRHSSPDLSGKLMAGLAQTGAEVILLGCGPTPMLYFSVFQLDLDGGIMITGSHNPPSHNGFKMMLGKKALFGEGIQELGRIAAQGEFASGDGKVTETNVLDAYITRLAEAFKTGGRPLKVTWDPGNGAAGEVVKAVAAKLPGEHILLNADIDGDFPAHHPDPTVPENLEQLIETVKNEGCDFGVAFDGDGDRIGAVDATGRIIWGDQLMVLYARDVLKATPGAAIIADVKASQVLFDDIAAQGGKPVMCATGHSLVKAKMLEEKALLAGEMSGHIFFADSYYGYDDGIYAAVRLLNLLGHSDETLAEMIDALPEIYNTPEIRIDCDGERKFTIIDEIKARVKETPAEVNETDGVRVLNEHGWWLARASNTQSAIIVRCEAASKENLEKLRQEVSEQLRRSGIEAIN